MNRFDQWNDAIRNTESSLVNLLSAIAPWGAPLAPAVMAYNGMVTHLEFPEPLAVIIAGVIEILGLATVHTTLTFWQYNRRRIAGWKKRPTWLAGGMFGLYLVIILTVNVVLEWPRQNEYNPIVARALLSLLTVPAAVTLAIRAQHTEMIHDEKTKPVAEAQPKTQPEAQPEVAKSNRERILELHHAQPHAPHAQIAEVVGVSRQYVDKVIGRNGYRK